MVRESFMKKAGYLHGKGPEPWEGAFQAERNDLSASIEQTMPIYYMVRKKGLNKECG